ncbi:hypothetical protein, partial [Streptomyces sp. cf124]|uniref:hypothetical protein n=1 Tax=Streptomyces sp. cf124 TaxID=1761903 RepID=UPI001C434319
MTLPFESKNEREWRMEAAKRPVDRQPLAQWVPERERMTAGCAVTYGRMLWGLAPSEASLLLTDRRVRVLRHRGNDLRYGIRGIWFEMMHGEAEAACIRCFVSPLFPLPLNPTRSDVNRQPDREAQPKGRQDGGAQRTRPESEAKRKTRAVDAVHRSSGSAADGASPSLRSNDGERDAQHPASAPAERERNTRAQRGCSLAHRAAMWYPLRG